MSWLENLFISEENKLKIAEIKLYIQNENYDRALLILDTIIGSRTVFIELYLLEAYCHIKKENYELATKKLYKVFDIDKNSSEGIYYKGLIYKGLNDYDNALDNLRKAINLGYDKYNIYNDLADLYIQKKEYDKAFIQLKISLTKENNNLNTYKKIVNILIEQNNIEMIIDFCNKALDVKSDIFFIDILSQTYLKNNDDVKALELLQNYIKVFSYPEIYINLAKIYIKSQKYDLALENIEKGLILFSDNLDLKIQKMEVCYYKKDYLGIIKTSKKVLIQELDNYKILLYLGISFFYTKEKEKAILYIEESYKLKKDSLNCCYLSLIFFDDKKIEISFNLLFEALELTENQAQKLEIYQKIYFNYDKIANKEKALEFAKKALEIAKDNEKMDIQKFIANLHKERNSSAIENENDFKNYYIKNNTSVYNLLKKIRFYLKKYPKFQNFETKIDELIYEMNQPLNISIMGEFKAGKSTFINALLGKKIAPMGVTPTTATLNFFKYGKENKIKLIKMDNSFEELEIKDISKYTDERVLDKEKIESVNYLEIFLDWEKLKEINIIDTPGLNAGIKRHEDITHEFIKKSDIIIWVFDVEQAGKQSEKIFFEKIKSYSKHTIAVINGIDKVDEKEEVDEVINYIKSSLGSFFDQVIAVSAKKALYAKIDNITQNYNESGFIELESCLENNIYSKISKIKIDNIFYNMKELFNEIETSINIEKTKNLEIITKSELIKNYVLNFEKELIKTEFIIKSKLKTELDLLTLKLAKDIKSFIKPTQGIIESIFGKNKFENEEKEFTISKLKLELKNIFDSYDNDLKIFMEEKSNSLINTIFDPKTKKIFLQLDNDFFKNDNSSHSFFEFYSIQKNANIYNEIINPSYYYYLGFIDSGSINNFFNVISNETDLSEEKIHRTLLKFLPDIFENLNNSFIIWKKSYFNFIDIFIENILKSINDEFFNINTEVFDQLIFLKEEIINLEHE